MRLGNCYGKDEEGDPCDILGIGSVDDTYFIQGPRDKRAEVFMDEEEILKYVDWIELVLDSKDPIKVKPFINIKPQGEYEGENYPDYEVVSCVVFHPDDPQTCSIHYSIILSARGSWPIIFNLCEEDLRDFVRVVRLLNDGDQVSKK
jgi:hypothetical protein